MSKPYLSIVIPAYNEAGRLPETLKKVRFYLENRHSTPRVEYEVLIINDGSNDETAKVVSELINPPTGGWSNFKLISYEKNRGKGYAVKTGMLAATGEWRLLMDADNSTDVGEVEKLLKYSENFEVIIGSRYLNKDSIKIKQPLMRRIISRLGNLIVRIVLGIKSVDTQCGFKLFSASAAENIFSRQTIERWGFDVEILTIALHQKYQIKEVPVDWFDAEGSQVKKTAVFKTLKEIWQVKRNLMQKKY